MWLNFAVIEEVSGDNWKKKSISKSKSTGSLVEGEEKEGVNLSGGIEKDKLVEHLSLLPNSNLRNNKVGCVFAKVLIPKILAILFPHKKAPRNFSSDDGRHFALRRLTVEESYLRGTEVPSIPADTKEELMREVREEIYNRNSARNLLALAQDKPEVQDKWSEFVSQVEKSAVKEEESDDVHATLLQLKYSPVPLRKPRRARTVPVLNVEPSLEACTTEINRTLSQQLVLKVAVKELASDVKKKYVSAQGDLIRLINDAQSLSFYFRQLESCFFPEGGPQVSEEEVEKERRMLRQLANTEQSCKKRKKSVASPVKGGNQKKAKHNN